MRAGGISLIRLKLITEGKMAETLRLAHTCRCWCIWKEEGNWREGTCF